MGTPLFCSAGKDYEAAKYVAPHFQCWQSLLDPMIAIIGSLDVL